jgi:hypothetical protein
MYASYANIIIFKFLFNIYLSLKSVIQKRIGKNNNSKYTILYINIVLRNLIESNWYDCRIKYSEIKYCTTSYY